MAISFFKINQKEEDMTKDLSNHHIPSLEDDIKTLMNREQVSVIPKAEADPVLVKVDHFLNNYKQTVVNIYDQMIHRAQLLEDRAVELRKKAEAMVRNAEGLTSEFSSQAQEVVDNHYATSALQFVQPKGVDNE